MIAPDTIRFAPEDTVFLFELIRHQLAFRVQRPIAVLVQAPEIHVQASGPLGRVDDAVVHPDVEPGHSRHVRESRSRGRRAAHDAAPARRLPGIRFRAKVQLQGGHRSLALLLPDIGLQVAAQHGEFGRNQRMVSTRSSAVNVRGMSPPAPGSTGRLATLQKIR
jgi:hypothetical protein